MSPIFMRTFAPLLSFALITAPFARADILHVVPSSTPAAIQTLSPLPGGASLTIQTGFSPWAAHSLIASVSDPTVAWLSWPWSDPTPDVPPIGTLWQVMTLSPGQPVGEVSAWGGGGQVNLIDWLPPDDPAEPYFIEPLLGFRAQSGGGWLNGWVRLRCYFANPGPTSWARGWHALDIVDYAYETSPGLPIPAGAIPAPGAVTLLAFGAAAAQQRRRQ